MFLFLFLNHSCPYHSSDTTNRERCLANANYSSLACVSLHLTSCTTMSNRLQKDVVLRFVAQKLDKASSVCCNSVNWEATSSGAAVAARRLAFIAYCLQASARAPACNGAASNAQLLQCSLMHTHLSMSPHAQDRTMLPSDLRGKLSKCIRRPLLHNMMVMYKVHVLAGAYRCMVSAMAMGVPASPDAGAVGQVQKGSDK